MGSLISYFIYPELKHAFYEACHSGDTTRLRQFIVDKKFDVNRSLIGCPILPLHMAIGLRSFPVVTLLLEHGADVSYDFDSGIALSWAISSERLDIISLLLEQTSRVIEIQKAVRATKSFNDYKSKDGRGEIIMLELVLFRAVELADSLEVDPTGAPTQALGKYARLCLAILRRDEDQVRKILKRGDYDSYAKKCGRFRIPADLASRLGGPALINAFVYSGVNIKLSCKHTAQLVELGVELGFGPKRNYYRQHPCIRDGCFVLRRLQKLWLLDKEFVRRRIPIVLTMSVAKFRKLPSPYRCRYEEEISRMKAKRLSSTTSYASGKNLYDFILIGVNDAARYSRNVEILKIYKDNKKDFQKTFPSYGSALNNQLRKGLERCKRLESAWELLSVALGANIPEDLSEFIFGNFSNEHLKRFSLELIK